jgi:hypothetical protein
MFHWPKLKLKCHWSQMLSFQMWKKNEKTNDERVDRVANRRFTMHFPMK